MTELTK